MLQTFDLMYIQKGIANLSDEDLKQLVPTLLPSVIKAFDSISTTHSPSLFSIFLKLLAYWQPPDRGSLEADDLGKTYGFDGNPQLADYLCGNFTNIFNLDLTVLADQDPSTNIACPGVTSESFRFLTSNLRSSFPGSSLLDTKVNIVRFLLAGGFSETQQFLPLLIASYDTNSKVSSPAEDAFKRLKVDMESEHLIKQLHDLTLGHDDAPPVKPAIQAKIIQLLCKSIFAANYRPNEIYETGINSQYFRCNQAAMQFVRWMCIHSSDSALDPIASGLLLQIESRITDLGWPRPNVRNLSSSSMRTYSYEAIGAIIRRVPRLLSESNLTHIVFLLDSLEQDTKEFKPSIQESLSEILPVLHNLSFEAKQHLQQILLKYIVDPGSDQSCKYVAIRYAVRAAPFSDATARYICLAGLNRKNRPDVIEEAKRGLHPYWFQTVNPHNENDDKMQIDGADSSHHIQFPKFSVMLETIDTIAAKFGDSIPSPSINGLSLDVFNETLKFLQQILTMNAVENQRTVLIIDEQWETRLETAIDFDEDVRRLIRQHLATMEPSDVEKFISLSYKGIEADNSDLIDSSDIWRRLLSQSPSNVISDLSGDQERAKMLTLLNDSKRASNRQALANGIGIISTHPSVSSSKISTVLEDILSYLEYIDGQKSDKVHGLALTLGYILSRLSLRGRLQDISEKIISNAISFFETRLLNGTDNQIVDASLESVSQLALFGVFKTYSNAELIEKLNNRLIFLASKKENDKALNALGNLSIGQELTKETYVKWILDTSTSKHIEFMFSSGEALSVIASEWNSKVLERSFDVQGSDRTSLDRSDKILGEVLDQVLASCKTPKPVLRKFSCIWLLSLVQYCGHLPAIKEHLEIIHVAFMRFLSDRDEIIQESASRGLSMVYDLGDTSLRQDLVRNLVQSFTSDRRTGSGGTISEDTQLFEPGVLDTGDGSVSTYKDILNLASEIGDPSLIYRFMSLAAHSALWASRKGAAFGLGSILSKSSLDDLLDSNDRLSKNLIPKLYRYRFDPNTSVQQAMKGIWDSLVKDKTAAINDNFDAILSELLKSMGDREWRIRQASATALSDLLQGKPVDRYIDQLETIWQMSFHSVDDIKDSVRAAGMQLTRGLATSLVRYIEVGSEAQASQILDNLVPFLTGNSGLQSDAKEVQAFALDTILKLCSRSSSSSSSRLQKFIPDLIEQLLDLLSTLEPQAMNYLALNAEKYGLTSSVIDASRLAGIRGSPMMEAVEQLIEQIGNDQLMKQVVQRLIKIIRRSVGLPSKVGASRVVVTLTMRNLQSISLYADSLMTACRAQILDRNDTVSQSYCVALGYLCRAASTDVVLEYQSYLTDLYVNADNSRPRAISGLAINAISVNASDKFSNMSSAFLPFVFLAKHDPEKDVQENFNLVWTENTAGTGAIELHLKEIVALVNTWLGSQNWTIRQVAAQAVAEASNLIGNKSTVDLDVLFSVIIQACGGRSWTGKHNVVDALVSLAIKSETYVTANVLLLERLKKTILTEIKRRNIEYQKEVIVSGGKFIASYPDEELYDVLFEIVDTYFDSSEDEDTDMDSKPTSNTNVAKELDRNKYLSAAANSFSVKFSDCHKILRKICSYIISVLSPSTKIQLTWRTKVAATEHFIHLLKILKEKPPGLSPVDSSIVEVWKKILTECAVDLNHERVRIESVRAADNLLELIPSNDSLKGTIIDDLKGLLSRELSPVVITQLRNTLNSYGN